ncbi:Cystatin-B [Anabarilius grahami]|uniref:Cystatin-B n=1 Tax=Anabarilius grahami TaxID=495550 RepID=A0A3N0XPI8_ANAGA|nr:Cystatin-B [Anabarilius grahami]
MSMNMGWKEEEDASPDVQKFCNEVKASIEKKLGKKSIYNAINFRAVETKILYIAKVHVGNNECVHLKMSQSLPCYGGEVKLEQFQYPKSKEDDIEPF